MPTTTAPVSTGHPSLPHTTPRTGHRNPSAAPLLATAAFLDGEGSGSGGGAGGGGVSYDTFQRVCGRGFAPWEVHRPQQAVRELLTAGAFKGAVLDMGCGIGGWKWVVASRWVGVAGCLISGWVEVGGSGRVAAAGVAGVGLGSVGSL